MRIQSNLGSDIAMAFDECIKIPLSRANMLSARATAPTAGSSVARPRLPITTAATTP